MEVFSSVSPFCSDYHSVRTQSDPHSDRCKIPGMTCLDEFVSNKTAGNLGTTANTFGEQWTSNCMTDLDMQSFVNATTKEYINQEMPPYQLQKLIQSEVSGAFSHQNLVSHISKMTPSSALSYDFCNSNTPHLQIGFNSVRTDDIFYSGFIEGTLCHGNKYGATTTYITHKKSLTVPAATNQFTWEMDFSPEQMPSITVCSDDNGYYDCIPVAGDPKCPVSRLPDSSAAFSDNCFQQSHCDWGEVDSTKYRCFMENSQSDFHKVFSSSLGDNLFPSSNMWTQKVDLWRTPDVSDATMIFNADRSECMDFLQSQIQLTGSLQLNQQSLSNESSDVQSHWYSVQKDECHNQKAEQQSYKMPQICLEQSNVVQNVALESSSILSGPVRAAEHTDLKSLSFCEILCSFIRFKNMPMKNGNVRVPFLKYVHSRLCSGSRCNCKQYDLLVTHFENCHYLECKICVPARELCVTNNDICLAYGKAKDDLSRASFRRDSNGTSCDTIGESMPPLKRVKMENSFSVGIGVSHVVDPSVDQPYATGQPLYVDEWPEAHLFNNLNTINVYKGLSSTKEYPDNHGVVKDDVTDSAQSLDLCNAGNRKDDLSVVSVDRDSNDTCSVTIGEIMPPMKSLQMENSFPLEIGVSSVVGPSVNVSCVPGRPLYLDQWPEALVFNNVDTIEVNKGLLSSNEYPENPGIIVYNFTDNAQKLNLSDALNPLGEEKIGSVNEAKDNFMDNVEESRGDSLPNCFEEPIVIDPKEEIRVKSEAQTKSEEKHDSFGYTADIESEKKSRKLKLLGVSLADFFTPRQMKEHMSSCRRWKRQEIRMEAFEATGLNSVNENSCQLCAMDRLVFLPIPIYCSCCGILIKRKLIYYWALDDVGAQYYFCTSCFKMSRGDNISFHGISISKAKLHKERNDKENEESWVQCDKCKGWQHQICALYNDKRDLEGRAEYICPQCCLEEMEIGKRLPLPNTTFFGAKDLPSTMLSNHIEQRLFRRLKQETRERARFVGKNPDEVPGAEDLVVRVVLSVNKHLKVKQEFLDIFHGENYPADFPYRSRKIEGVDVCIFGMYVQEFGSECGYPNQRCVYISYLDSVKYFRPEIVTVTGEALRTFVYHEILIGYLDYCKKQGFATCHIWACPPLRGEDYILYCHPETQRTPKSEKLRQWYKSMLRKAARENVVVGYTNIYEHLFASGGECNTKITAARLPYFDGGYWSGAAEDIIRNIEQECRGGLQKVVKKMITKRTLKAFGQSNSSDDVTKDILVMEKLGQTILPVKEDFIVVHLHFTCTLCHEVILSGSRWFCHQCKGFQLCTRCLDKQPNSDKRGTHTSSAGKKHVLTQVAVDDVPHNTDDKDASIDNSFFENTHTFLGFCQTNHYQFDTLRRAKHSSMMILYHLDKPAAFTLEKSCRICRKDVSADQSWHCETCPEFDVCDACYQRKGNICHVHKLTRCRFMVSCGAKTRKAQLQQHRSLQERRLLDVLMHASKCHATKSNPCHFPKCLQIRRLFQHAGQCNLRAAGGCIPCKKIWFLLQLHSQSCSDSSCCIPRCIDIKKHSQMHVLHSSTRCRAAVLGLAGI